MKQRCDIYHCLVDPISCVSTSQLKTIRHTPVMEKVGFVTGYKEGVHTHGRCGTFPLKVSEKIVIGSGLRGF